MRTALHTLTSLLFVVCFFCPKSGFSQEKSLLEYESTFDKIDALAADQKPKEALQLITDLNNKARQEGNIQMLVRSALYKIGFRSYLEENGLVKSITQLKQDVTLAKQPEKSILQSILAESYWNYYQANGYKISERTDVNSDIGDDIQLWSIKKLIRESLRTYLSSLSEISLLQNTPVASLKNILTGDSTTRYLRPTLYDLLASRALTVFMNTQSALINSEANEPDFNSLWFADGKTFSELPVPLQDSINFTSQALKIFQNILHFHSAQNNGAAFADADLHRLKFIYQRSTAAGKEKYFSDALNSLLTKNEETEIASDILFELASLYKNGNVKSDTSELKLVKAVELAEQAIQASPKSTGAKNAGLLISNIKSKTLRLEIKGFSLPEKPIQILYSYKNVDSIFLKIYKIPVILENPLSDFERKDLYTKFLKSHTVVKDLSVALPIIKDYQTHNIADHIDGLPNGKYIIIAQNHHVLDTLNDDLVNSYTVFNVSNLGISNRFVPPLTQYRVVNSYTGSPLKDVEIKEYTKIWTGKQYFNLPSFKTDEHGFSSSTTPLGTNSALITYGGDSLTVDIYAPDRNEMDPQKSIILFTDRPIYRPGQIVFYKGLLLHKINGKNSIIPDEGVKIKFQDVNGSAPDSASLTTNEYGTFQGNFKIPSGKLNGRMRLNTDYGEIAVQVEEYKRPTFEVLFEKSNERYKLNDSITVKGHATTYSGYQIGGATVKYIINRTVAFDYTSKQIATGTTATNADGTFDIKFFADEDHLEGKYYTYNVSVDVTDLNGETRTAEKSINAGKKDLVLNINLPAQLFLSSKVDSIPFSTLNLNNQPVKAKVTARWYLLESPGKLKTKSPFNIKPEKYTLSKEEFIRTFPNEEYAGENDPALWKNGEQIFSQTVSQEFDKDAFTLNEKDLNPGYYKVLFSAENEIHDTIGFERIIRIYDQKPATIQTPDEWLVAEKTVIKPNESALFRIAGITPGASAYYEVYSKGIIVDKVWLKVSPEQTFVKITSKPDMADNFNVQFSITQNGTVYNSMNQVNIVDTKNQLDVKFLTFRNKLEPGEKESWKLKISNKAGEKQMAELVATLYDASLDGLRRMEWPNIYNINNYYSFNWSSHLNDLGRGSELWFLRKALYYLSPIEHQYEKLDNYGFNFFSSDPFSNFQGFLRNREQSKINKLDASLISPQNAMNEVVIRGYKKGTREESTGASYVVSGKEVQDVPISNVEQLLQGKVAGLNIANKTTQPKRTSEPSAIVPRTNFNETAFFYPQLHTNEQGEINIEFTIPQSLTRYQLRGFAHTKDLKTASFSRELITQKQLAITANAPRFFREGDTIVLSAKLNNLSGKKLKGNAILELSDALTGGKIQILAPTVKSIQKFQITNATDQVVKWPLIIPAGISAITYKLTAESGKYSDGEEMTLPVLPNAMLVTETIPLNVRGNTSKTFTMDKLLQSENSVTIRNQGLTMEFTSNPVWYAVQALPYLMEYPYECAEQTFSRFYANSFATGIINSSPKIKEVFNQWQQTGNEDALLSNLEKNQELKSVLLEETPWVRNASSESERKKRLSTLFDLNRMSNELKNNFDKLQNMQNANGSFPWFKGMPENRYITQYIAQGMAQLKYLKLVDDKYPDFNTVLNKAIIYLDGQLIADYEKEIQNSQVSYLALHYLYARSYSKQINTDSKFKKASDYYLKQIAENWEAMGIYQQGLAALVLHRSGNHAEAIKIVNLLKETAQQNDEMGMYWAGNIDGWWWYQNSIETQALLIEVFDEVASDTKSVDEMKIWLLKKKQTTDWKTTKATTAACYALLMHGYNLLEESAKPEIRIGGKTFAELGITDQKNEAGTGYQKVNILGEKVKPEMGRIEIKNNNKSIAWGGLYWQYFEQLDKITPSATGVKIKKQLFLKQHTAKGDQLEPLNAANALKPGDLLKVRIEIYTDRDMEYVHLKDMRSSGFEPVNVISQYKYQDGLGYYESTKDVSTNFFIDYMRKGVYVFEYELRVSNSGNFSNGITTLECMYAPEFTTHSEGIRAKVKQ